MNVKVIKIGTSKGIRIPFHILKTLSEPEEFKLTLTDYGLFLKPIEKETRNGWKKAYLNSNCCIIDKQGVKN